MRAAPPMRPPRAWRMPSLLPYLKLQSHLDASQRFECICIITVLSGVFSCCPLCNTCLTKVFKSLGPKELQYQLFVIPVYCLLLVIQRL